MKIHDLKIHPEHFKPIRHKQKCFEVRKNDRDYQVNDCLCLQEYDPNTQQYTGNAIYAVVSYVMHGGIHSIDEDTVVMSIKVL